LFVNEQGNHPRPPWYVHTSFRLQVRFVREIVPYPGLEIGFENKNIEYYSELAQDVNTKRISILFIGRDLNDQILRFTIIRKGINLALKHHGLPVRGQTYNCGANDELAEIARSVHEIRLTPRLPAFEKKLLVATFLEDELTKRGVFYFHD